MPSSVWPCSHPTRSSAKVLPVQLEEDAALILERHPMLLHFAKNGLEFRTCVHKSVSTFSTAVSGSKYKLKQAAVSLKSSKLAADLRHIWLLEGRVHPTIRVQVVECRCWCRFSSFAHNRRTLQRRPYLHTRNYVYSSCIRTRGIERRATSLKKDETVCHGLDTQSASYRDPRQIWRSPLTGVVSPWRKINGRRTTQISSWRWSTTTQQQVSAPSSEISFSIMGKCLSKSKCKLVFKWKQQRAHRATCRYGSKFWLSMQSWQWPRDSTCTICGNFHREVINRLTSGQSLFTVSNSQEPRIRRSRKFPLASFFATQQWQSNYTKRHCF